MSDSFFPFTKILHDRRALLSMLISGVSAVAISTLAVNYLYSSKIKITPIASVTILATEDEGYHAETKPISSLKNVNKSGVNSVMKAYLTNLVELCLLNKDIPNPAAPKNELVIVKTGAATTAGDLRLTKDVCASILKLNGSETIYAASDHPFKDAKSFETRVTVDRPSKDGG